MMTAEEMKSAYEAEPGVETVLRLAGELDIEPMEVIDRLRACGVRRQRFSHIVCDNICKVTYWMPLPEPPKMEEDNGKEI